MEKSPIRIGVCIPSGHTWEAGFALSLLSLIQYVSQTPLPGASAQSLFVINKRGSILPQLRQQLARDALRQGATHLLWLDSDMTFPPDILHRLIAHDKAAVGANCATKTLPSSPTARAFNGTPGGRCVYSGPGTKGLEKVWRLGFGVFLLKADVFKKTKPPHFGIEWNAEFQDHYGEDWFFCEKVGKTGDKPVEVWVDHDVSKDIGHIGVYTYSHDDVEIPANAAQA